MTPPPPFTPAELLEHGRSLRALARGVLGDESAAEDVVQDAWVLALERPPADRERIGGWLHTVVRNLALRRLRGERRRSRREQLAARSEGLPSATEAVESAAICKRLVDAVLELEEPYRTAISMRYFEGLAPREIASRLGVPGNTVRARLGRGLARLRERLDGDSEERGEGGRAGWAPALGVFAGWSDGRVAVPAAKAGLGGVLGVLTMAGLGKWAAGVLVVAVLGYGLLEVTGERAAVSPPARPDVAVQRDEAPPLATEGEARQEYRREDLAPAGTLDLAGLSEASAPAWSVVARHPFELQGVVVDAWRRPMPGVGVYVALEGQRFNRGTDTDRNGRFELRFQAAVKNADVRIFVRSERTTMSGMRSVNLVSGTPGYLHIDLERIPYRELFGAAAPNPSEPLDAAPGLRGAPDAAVRFVSDSGVEVDLPEEIFDSSEAWGDGFLEDSPPAADLATLAGLVRAADGRPATRTLVGVKLDGAGPGIWAVTNGAGEFGLAGLTPGTYSLHAGGDDYGLASARLTLAAGELQLWEPWLDRGRELRGRLLGPDGAPRVLLVRGSLEDERGEWSDTTLADERGVFAFPNAPAGALRIEIFEPRANAWGLPLRVESGYVADGQEHELRLSRAELSPASLSLSLVDESGAPIAGAEVRLLHRQSRRGVFLSATPNDAEPARYSISGLPAGDYRLEAGHAPHGWLDLGAFALDAGARLELGSFSFPAPGLLVANCDPQDLEGADDWRVVRVGPLVDSLAWRGWPLEPWQWSDLEMPGWTKLQLPPGDYALAVSAASTGRAWFPFSIDSAARTELELPLALLSDVTLRLVGGSDPAPSRRVILTDAGSGSAVLQTELEPAQSAWAIELLPGSYRVQVKLSDRILADESFTVDAATSELIEVELAP